MLSSFSMLIAPDRMHQGCNGRKPAVKKHLPGRRLPGFFLEHGGTNMTKKGSESPDPPGLVGGYNLHET